MNAALGIRVKSGWASAVLLQSEAGAPEVLHRARLLLADPKVPQSAQPYHRGFGSLHKDREILDRLTGIVYEATARSLCGFVNECRARGHEPITAALVVGSTIDPDRITNEHIRAHAYEAQLFRSALEQAHASAAISLELLALSGVGAVLRATDELAGGQLFDLRAVDCRGVEGSSTSTSIG